MGVLFELRVNRLRRSDGTGGAGVFPLQVPEGFGRGRATVDR